MLLTPPTCHKLSYLLGPLERDVLYAGMVILVLILKDSLRTFFKSLSWSLGVRSLSLSLGVRSLSWSLWVRSLSLFLVLARTCFHYSIIPIYSHIIVVSMHTISFNYTYLCLFCRHIALHL